MNRPFATISVDGAGRDQPADDVAADGVTRKPSSDGSRAATCGASVRRRSRLLRRHPAHPFPTLALHVMHLLHSRLEARRDGRGEWRHVRESWHPPDARTGAIGSACAGRSQSSGSRTITRVPSPDPAAHLDFAAVELDQPLDDRKPEAGAVVACARRSRAPGRTGRRSGRGLGRDADAGVLDR